MLQPPKEADLSFSAGPVDPIAPLRAALKGHYEIERQIGQGAFATVYLARDLKHERKVAIKVLNADPSSETGELRFIREIRMLARLQHPNILPLHDSGHVETLLYYVMPFVSGDTLRDRIDRQKRLPVDAACSIARDVADALAYAHAQGVIHRDIKPENILLSTGHPILADFGIARAIGLAGVRQLTRTGMGSPGTPAYMSPEQLLGDQELDGRSDTYSLGCVLYEMLSGKPPFAGKDGFVKRFTEPPPLVSESRRDVPGWMDTIVAKALQRSPADRYATARELVAALSAAGGSVQKSDALPETTALNFQPVAESLNEYHDAQSAKSAETIAPARDFAYWLSRTRNHPRIVLLVGALIFLGAAAASLAWPSVRGTLGTAQLDSTKFIVVPFAGIQPGGPQAAAADRLYDALTQWTGLPLVPDTKVSEAIAENRSGPQTQAQALDVARALGAGKLIWGRRGSGQNEARVRVHLYDVASGESRDEFFLDTVAQAYPAAAERLIRVANRPRQADGGDGLTRSYAAWVAYADGHRALSDWRLDEAQTHFLTAIRADPNYAPAHLWLAQIAAWRRQAPGVWAESARHAAADADKMTGRDRYLATGIGALADSNYVAACAAYSQLTRAEPLDFAGWYGLGRCQALDESVLPDARSPSGFRFQSSYQSAANSYLRSIAREPRVHDILPFTEVLVLLPIASTNLRRGFAATDRSIGFAAFPSLENDTIGFVPYPLQKLAVLQPEATRTQKAALEANIHKLLLFARQWANDFRDNPDALEALAMMLEANGVLDETTGSSITTTIATARRLSPSPLQRLRLASQEMRVRFKREDFLGARLLADSLLSHLPALDSASAQQLLSVAALTGRVRFLSVFARMVSVPSSVGAVSIAEPLRETAANLFAVAALGVCGEPAARLEQELDRRLQSYSAQDQRLVLRAALESRSFSMLVPCTAGTSALGIDAPIDRLQRMQQAFARNQRTTLAAQFDTVAARARTRRPGDLSFDYTYQQAWLRAASGDTAGALRQLDLALEALPTLSAAALQEGGASAAVGRAMILRADLAVARGDKQTARRWARAVSVLWAGADPSLQPIVNRMRTLSAP